MKGIKEKQHSEKPDLLITTVHYLPILHSPKGKKKKVMLSSFGD